MLLLSSPAGPRLRSRDLALTRLPKRHASRGFVMKRSGRTSASPGGHHIIQSCPNNFRECRVLIRDILGVVSNGGLHMNWKRFFLIAVAVGAFAFAAVPRSEARI